MREIPPVLRPGSFRPVISGALRCEVARLEWQVERTQQHVSVNELADGYRQSIDN